MKTIIKKLAYGEVVIIKFDDVITFSCNAINLDASYDIETGKITGKGSRGCKEFILKEIKGMGISIPQ